MNFFIHRYKKMGKKIDPKSVKLPPCLRINSLKIKDKELLKRMDEKEVLFKKINWLKNGYEYDADFSLGATPEYLFGYYYLQEAASQAVSEALDPQPGETVLDMCAAPGSKTTHISQLMKNEGTLVALDSNLSRIKSLNSNIERMGCKNVIVYRKDANYADDLEMEFDKVILDAPCSGNFTQEEDWFEIRSIEDIQNMANEQKKLIVSAIDVLKPGGTLIYSTCSLEPEENEQVVEYALEKFDVKLQPILLKHGDPGITEKTRLCKRFWPPETQGFFIAKFKKN